MPLVETDALILKSYSLAEADKIAVFFTAHQGLIKGVAKGAKRLKSKFGSSLEPFSIVHLSYFHKEEKELVSVQSLEIKKSLFEAASDPLFLQKFSYLSELLIEFAPPFEANEKLYRMSCACLDAAEANPQGLNSIALYFELWILRLAGYLPNWSKCMDCGNRIESNESASLQANFHLLCIRCQKAKNPNTLGADERILFEVAQTISPSRFIEFTSDKAGQVKKVSGILKRIIANALEKESVGERVSVTAP